MRMTRLHLPQPLAVGAELVVPAESAHHICKVLRLGVGDALHVFNADDGEFAATLTAAEGKTATVHCDAELERIAEPPVHITLMQALATGDRVDTAIQKATELGVAAIVLFRAERSQGKLSGRTMRTVFGAGCHAGQRRAARSK